MVSLRMTCLTGLIRRPPRASQLDDASAIASSSPCPIKTACISHQKSPPPSDPVILLPPSLRLSAVNGVVEGCPYTDFNVSPQYPCWVTLPCAHDDPWAPNLQLQALSKSDQCRSIHAQGRLTANDPRCTSDYYYYLHLQASPPP